MAATDSFKNLQYLSLVSKICQELDEGTGFSDKVLAEFIIDIAGNSDGEVTFSQKLKENGADMPDFLVKRLLSAVHDVLPPKQKDQDEEKKIGSPLGLAGKGKKEHGQDLKCDDDEPVLFSVYRGKVVQVMDLACFVELCGFRHRKEGMVHVSQIGSRPINYARDAVNEGQDVWVKVIAISGYSISLSMRDVDQRTGQDLSKKNSLIHSESSSLSSIDRYGTEHNSSLKRSSSPDNWEVKQLTASGVLKSSYYSSYVSEEDLENEEGIEVVWNNYEPPFLKEQTPSCPMKVECNSEAGEKYQTVFGPVRVDSNSEAAERCLAFDDSSFQSKIPFFGKVSPESPSNLTSSIQAQRQKLPICKLKYELVQAIHDNQVLVVIGRTGSGKSTQITQYLAEAGYTSKGKIACTQPRRIAAISVAERVAEEFGCKLGEEVGYSVRFEDCTSSSTYIKYITEDMLLREILEDANLSSYSVIMLDEVQERTTHTDVLFGLLKMLLKRRPDLRLIVSSATLDAENVSSYFFNSCIFTIPGRMFPVDVFYVQQPESDYLSDALVTVLQIHLTEPEGGILLFLTGQEEIDNACQILNEKTKELVPGLDVIPVYNALPSGIQTRIFNPAPQGKRKVVIATNIAEASLTIDGIFYVIDPGFVKQKVYNPKSGLDSLVISQISQARAEQRKGRAGRTGEGKCYRLYTENTFRNEMPPADVPEIQRTNLRNAALYLKCMGINDLLSFDFMDPPQNQTLTLALQQLYCLGALDESGLTTKLGRMMAEFPLDPPLSKMLLASVNLGCSNEILTIIAMLEAGNIFYKPRDKQMLVDRKKAAFSQPEGDHLTLLAVYESWAANDFSVPWCYQNFIQSHSLRMAQDVRKELIGLMDKYNLPVLSIGTNSAKIIKAIAAGFLFHAARRDPKGGYRTLVKNEPVYIHPSSTLFHSDPDWVIYHELVKTSKVYMRQVVSLDPKWLLEIAPRFFRVADSTQVSMTRQYQSKHRLCKRHRFEWY